MAIAQDTGKTLYTAKEKGRNRVEVDNNVDE